MAEGFPGFIPEASSEDDDDEIEEKKTSKKAERLVSKESKKDDKQEKRDREKAVPLEKLATDETSIIAAELARLRAEAAKRELTEAAQGSVEQTEAIPVVEFDEVLQQHIEAGEPMPEALDAAEEAAMELLGIEAEDAEESPTATDEADSLEVQAEHDEESDEDTSPATAAGSGGSGGGTTGAVGGGSGSGAGHGGGTSTPSAGAGGSGGASGTTLPGASGGGFTPAHVSASANVAPTSTERTPVAPYVLAGGLMGYLLGRRRGRIKTEKKLLPVQKKLETQVKNLEQQMVLREEKIRSLARKAAEVTPNLQAQMAERKQVKKWELRSEQLASKQQAASEKLGRVAFGSEAAVAAAQLRENVSPERIKSVALMTVPELVSIAAMIKLENGDVKRLYETNRLSDEGLRRVVKAYLAGEAYTKVLKEQLISPESASLELDPMQQSNALGYTGAPGGGQTQGQPSNQSHSAQAGTNYQQAPSSPYSDHATNAQRQHYQPAKQAQKRENRRNLIGAVIVVAILVILAVLFIF